MCCTYSDFFPFGGSVETSLLAERAFAALGSPGRFGLFAVDGPHHWFESELQASVAWMKQQLGIEPDAYSANADSFKRLDVGFSYEKVDVG